MSYRKASSAMVWSQFLCLSLPGPQADESQLPPALQFPLLPSPVKLALVTWRCLLCSSPDCTHNSPAQSLEHRRQLRDVLRRLTRSDESEGEGTGLDRSLSLGPCPSALKRTQVNTGLTQILHSTKPSFSLFSVKLDMMIQKNFISRITPA